jgi:lipoxygenase
VIRNIAGDKLAWLRDDEFARETVSGINPVSIERLTVFPPRSSLDPEIYGPLESALKEEHILGHLNGLSVSQVIIPNLLLSFCSH